MLFNRAIGLGSCGALGEIDGAETATIGVERIVNMKGR
jgi:hypothetical protein